MSTDPLKIQRNLLASIYKITNIEGDQYQVRDAMGQITQANLKRIQCEQVCRLFRILISRNVGVGAVESNIRRTFGMCSKYYQQTVKRKLMRMKLSDAYRKLREKKNKYLETWTRKDKLFH